MASEGVRVFPGVQVAPVDLGKLEEVPIWQVCYNDIMPGVDYWWDYPLEYCVLLDNKLLEHQRQGKLDELISFVWHWDPPKGPQGYVLDLNAMTIKNTTLDSKARLVRRVRRDFFFQK
jgi:hypothetical protein